MLALFLTEKRKKLLFLFFFFLFAGVLSFVYYSGILLFVMGIIIIFLFILLYLFVLQMELFGYREYPEESGRLKNSIKSKILNGTVSLLLPAVIGYFIYKHVSGFLKGAVVLEGSENILIAGWTDISRQIFTDYSLILIIITASLFISFLWFITIVVKKK